MDSSFWAVILALCGDLLIFCVEFYLFSVYRTVRSKPIDLNLEDREIKTPVFSESDTPLSGLVKLVWEIPYSEMGHYCGVEGQLYLALHKVVGLGLGLMAVVGCSILLPIYALGENEVDEDMNQLSMAHIIYQDDMMATSLIFLFLFSAAVLGMVAFYIKEVSVAMAIPTELSVTIDRYTVEIKNLPTDQEPSGLSKDVLELLKTEYEGDLLGVYVVPDYSEAYSVFVEKKDCEVRLEHYKNFEYNKGYKKKLKKYIWFGEEYDAIQYYQSKITSLSQKFEKIKQENKSRCSGYGYLVCKTPSVAHRIITDFKGSKDFLNSNKWEMRTAPPPGEINWENLCTHKRYFILIRASLYLFFFLFFFLLLTPTTLLQIFISFFDVIEAKPLYQGALSQLLPSLILLMYLSLIVRHTVLNIVKNEKLPNKSDETSSALVKFLIVTVTYTFIVPLVGLQVYAILENTFEADYKEWEDAIANKAAFAGQFFTIYITHLTFLKNGADLLQIPKLIRVKIRQWKSVTETEKLLAYEAYEFRWAYEYGVSISALFIILSFSIAYPLILVIGFMFFTARYFTAKYNLLCFYHPVKHTTGNRISNYVTNSMLLALMIASLFTCLLIFLNNTLVYLILAGILIVLSVVAFSVLIWRRPQIEREIKKEFGKQQFEEEGMVFPEDIHKYFHPLCSSEEAFAAKA